MIALPGIAIQDTIYESAHSLVYRGIRDDGLAIVIKRLKQEYPSPQALTRYRQEYAITRSLNLEGVVKAYSQQDYQRTLVILLEDFGGESLEHWMQQRSDFCPMPLLAFLRLAIDLTDILGSIHAASIIHKDINPGNIVLNPATGVVKIIDFGIATQFNRTKPTFKSHYGLEGTLAYLSPEQTGRMNRLLDYRTDFYSLGVTFYELLAGQLPFTTTDILELVHCHIAKPPVPLDELSTMIPKPVSEIILKLMAKNAEDRYQSAWGIKADLEICLHQFAETGHIDHTQLGLRDVSEQFQIPQKLYGREAEIAALLAVFERVATDFVAAEADDLMMQCADSSSVSSVSHPLPEMLLVSGYAGIGKSALVQELYKPITAKRGYFIAGKFDQFQRNIPYSAIVDALQKLVRQLLSEPDEQVQQWRSRLLAALGSNGQLIIAVIPEVELIVGKQQPVPEVGSTEAQNRFNLVFQQFIRVFCSKEHPLVIFLDDLQWIDSATLKLIELMLLDEQTQFLFLIGAYRDNEVSPTHPLVLTLEGLRKQGAVLHKIVLSPLTLEPLSKLIAEALHRDAHTVLPLAELVLRKTGGNPFLVCEVLQLLYSENLLRFDADRLSWRWNFDQIRALNLTDNVNVLGLLLNKLKKLPEVSRQLLQLAACIGAEFDLETLAIVCEQSPKAVFQGLLTPIQAGLIQPLSELDEDLLVQDYKFLHDRVQQAAYALIDENQKQAVHLQIGRKLWRETAEMLANQVFAIADHLNQGIDLVTEQAERDEIAQLHLLAGRKAKGAIAYTAALEYLTTGVKLLTADSWQRQYDLSLALYSEAAEVAYLAGDFDQIEEWAAVVLQQAKTVLGRVKVYEVKIQTCTAQKKQIQAIQIGLQVLDQLGVSLPEIPTELDVQQKLTKIKAALASRITELADLPVMTDANKLSAMHILSSIAANAYSAAPSLFLLIVLEQLNLSINYGNAHFSTFTYACYGILLSTVLRDIEEADQFGCLALSLVKRLNANSLKSRTFFMVGSCIAHRKYHVQETLPLFKEAYSSGIESGDLEYAGYAMFLKCQYSYWSGLKLIELNKELTICSQALAQLKQGVALSYSQLLQQVVLNLSSTPENPCYLSGNAYNQEKLLCTELDAINKGELSDFYLYKLILCYLFGEFFELINYAVLTEQYLGSVAGCVMVALFYFYDSLARLALYSSVSISEQENFLLKVNTNQDEMHIWAHHAPMNYLHKFHLVEAEKARVLGQVLEAEEFYEQAIAGASKNEYIQEEALAYELAAKFYLERGREKFAKTYMKEAHYCYERWGAMAKVKDLETRYPQLFPQLSNVVSTPVRTTTGTSSNTTHTALDLATVMKAAQAISSEIELEQLLRSLLQILIENAGAQTGCLLLENSSAWTIEAACELNGGEQVCATRVLQSISITNRLPESIIHYVIRTNESVILNHATREGNFINDPYIQRNQTQSLLCLPLLNQSKLVGVLYLENQLAAGAFTPDRTQVLNLLSTQAAIAIENARLYLQLRASESRMKQFLEAVPVGISILDVAGRPYYINQRGIQLVGEAVDPTVTADQLAEAYQAYMAGTDQPYPIQKMPIVRALSGECTTVDDMEIYQNNQTIPLEVWGTPVFDEQGNVAYAIAAFQDITERKQAEHLLANYNRTLEQQVAERTAALQESEAALRHREQELRLIADALPALISYVDADRCYQFINRTHEVWFNRSRDEILGKPVHALLGKMVYQRVEPYINQVFEGQTVALEAEIPSSLGTRCISATLIPDFDANAQVRGFYSLITDISDRKRAEHASILEERNRMAREIHDTLAQSFTGILLQVGAATQVLTDELEAPQEHLEMLEMIDELARTGLAEARRSVAALRPQLLEDSDLQSALHRLATQMRAFTNTTLIYESKGIAYPLPTDVENHLLRMGQEALTNAIKYAEANEIWLELVYEAAQCLLRIKDNGQGFSVGSMPSVGGFGLLGMSERAEQMGAQLTIQSQPGQGTEILVIVNRA